MKKTFILLITLLSMIKAYSQKEYVKAGDSVPDFTVTMFDGKKIQMKELKGKVVLLNFWATWCPPCRQELTRVEKDIIERFKNDNFVFLPVSREENYETLQKFREKTGYTFPMGMDPERKIYSLFADQEIPRNYLIDKSGKIIKIEVGYDENDFNMLIKEIENLLIIN